MKTITLTDKQFDSIFDFIDSKLEFVFITDGETQEECARFHDVEYLDITEFNYHHWISNKMEDY